MIIQANDPRGRGSLLISMTSCRACTMPREMIDAPTCAYVCYVSEGREGLSSEKAGKVSETYPDPSALEDIFRGVGMDYQDMDLNINIDLLSLQKRRRERPRRAHCLPRGAPSPLCWCARQDERARAWASRRGRAPRPPLMPHESRFSP